METVKVTASKEYTVHIGTGFLNSIGEKIKGIKRLCRVVLISDDTVFSLYGEKAVEMGRKTPKIIANEGGVVVKDLITYEDTPCFAVKSYSVTATDTTLTEKPAVYCVTEGEGTIIFGDESLPLKKGDYFFLPASAEDVKINSTDSLTVIACLPPKK